MDNIVLNADIYWAFLNHKNMNDKYSVDLCNLSDAACEKLKSVGLNVNDNDKQPEKGKFITCKSDYPLIAFNSAGDKIEEIYENDGLKVGNGSKARAMITYYDWRNNKGRSPKMLKFFITDLIPYESSSESGDKGPATAMELEDVAL